MFYLFYNHIRRSHFVKTGQYRTELIDNTCYYAQLAQLTLVLNEIFELISHYKCQNSDVTPSQALKKCPLKRLYPAYYEIITKPIDLTLIRNKLDNGEYLSFHLFEQDLLLLFKNAIVNIILSNIYLLKNIFSFYRHIVVKIPMKHELF
jgi:hypothetical protein